jgi:hypothetical protein
MFRLRSIGVFSSAKILAVIHGVLGILIGFVFLVIGVAGVFGAPVEQKLGMAGLILLAVLIPVFYAVLGFVAGAIWAFVYNLVAQYVGGLILRVDALPFGAFEPSNPPGF